MAQDFSQTLQAVAQRSAKLGFTVGTTAKSNQLQLNYANLKLTINDEVISSHFYLEDSMYHKVNYPAFKDIKAPLGAKHIVHVLAQLQKKYTDVVKLHQQIMTLGEQIDALRTKIKLTGLIDKSVKDSSNYAENLVEAPTGITHDPADVTKRALARLIDASEFKRYVQNYLKLLKHRDPARYRRYLQQLHKSLENVHNSADDVATAPTTVTRTRQNVLAPKALPSSLSASKPILTEPTPLELIQAAIKTSRRLRHLQVDPMLRKISRQHYMLMLSLVPRQRNKQFAFTPRDVDKLGHELHAKTGYDYRFVEIILKAKRLALAYNIRVRS